MKMTSAATLLFSLASCGDLLADASPVQSVQPIQSTKSANPVSSASPTPTAQQRFESDMQSLRVSIQLIEASHQGIWNEEQIEQIKKICLDLATRYPDQADPHAILGDFLAEINRPQEAFAEFETAQKLAPDRADLLAAESTILVSAGDTINGTLQMEKAVEKAPSDPEMHFRLANLYFLFRQDLFPPRHSTEAAFFDMSLLHFQRAAELAPQDIRYARAYAETFYALPHPDWNAALLAWNKVLTLSPEKSQAQSHLARINIRLKNKVEATRCLALVTDPAMAPMKKALQKQIDRL